MLRVIKAVLWLQQEYMNDTIRLVYSFQNQNYRPVTYFFHRNMTTHNPADDILHPEPTLPDGTNPSTLIWSDNTKDPVFIGVAGGTASGKTTFCSDIIHYLHNHGFEHAEQRVSVLSQDAFYRNLTPTESEQASHQDFNFDDPSLLSIYSKVHYSFIGAIDFDLWIAVLQNLKDRKPARIPIVSISLITLICFTSKPKYSMTLKQTAGQLNPPL